MVESLALCLGTIICIQAFESQNSNRRITYFDRSVDGGSLGKLTNSTGIS